MPYTPAWDHLHHIGHHTPDGSPDDWHPKTFTLKNKPFPAKPVTPWYSVTGDPVHYHEPRQYYLLKRHGTPVKWYMNDLLEAVEAHLDMTHREYRPNMRPSMTWF